MRSIRSKWYIVLMAVMSVFIACCYYVLQESTLLHAILTVEAHGSSIRCIAFSHDGTLVATGGDDGTAKVWRFINNKVDFSISEMSAVRLPEQSTIFTRTIFTTLAFSADDHFLVLGGDNISAILWNFVTGKLDNSIIFPDPINCLVLTPDGKYLVIGGGRMINTGSEIIFPKPGHFLIWDLPSMTARYESKNNATPVTALALSSDGKLLAVGFYDGSISVLDITTSASVSMIKADKGQIKWLAFLPNRREIFSLGTSDKEVTIWSVDSGLPVLKIKNTRQSVIYSCSISPDGQLLITGDEDNNIRLWSTTTGNLLLQTKTRTFLSGKAFPAYCLAFSPDGTILVAGLGEGTLLFWDLSEIKRELETVRDKKGVD